MIYEILDALLNYYVKFQNEDTLADCLIYLKKCLPLDDIFLIDRELDRMYRCRKCGKLLEAYHFKDRYADRLIDCVGYACHNCDIDFGNSTGE